MKKISIIAFVLLCLVGLSIAQQSTPYIMTEFPVAILPSDTAIWIKWTGAVRAAEALGGAKVDSGTIYYSRTPGGSVINNYEWQIPQNEVLEDNIQLCH